MYNRLFVETCGLFNIWHLLTVILFFGLLALLLFLSRNLTEKQMKLAHVWIAVGITILEIIKVYTRIRGGEGPDSWVPLYYCSLFIFAIWFSLSKWEPLKRAGQAYITMGGILAAIVFTIYPSTSLAMYPLLHPSTIHSFVYHLIMCCTGLLFLRKRIYVPQKKDALYYFIFLFIACIPSVYLNETIGTNCMFLRHPFHLPLLQPLMESSKPLYMLLVCVAQSVLMFWFNYGLYFLFKKREEKS